jgi:hypothetical protein
METGSIKVDDLGVFPGEYPPDCGPGSLGPLRHNRHLLAEYPVHQGGFAYIGFTDNRYYAEFIWHQKFLPSLRRKHKACVTVAICGGGYNNYRGVGARVVGAEEGMKAIKCCVPI